MEIGAVVNLLPMGQMSLRAELKRVTAHSLESHVLVH